MNELFFLIHVLCSLIFNLGALQLGRQALTVFITMNAVLANLFVVKQISLFGMNVTCGDVFAIGGVVGLSLLQEYFGKEAAKRALRISFFAMIFFLLSSYIHLNYIPAAIDKTHSAYVGVLSSTPRIVFASLIVYFLVQKTDVMFFGWLKTRLKGRYLSFRVGICLFVMQFLDTILFSFIGLYGVVASIVDVIVFSFCIKCIVISGNSFLITFSRVVFRKLFNNKRSRELSV